MQLVDCRLVFTVMFRSHNLIMSSTSNNRKRGRPKGSKSKSKKKQCQSDESDHNFEAAFGHVDTHLPPCSPDSKLDEDNHFGMFGGNSDGDSEALAGNLDDDETNVGFGSADIFDVEEILELGRSDEHDGKKDDIIEELKNACIAENSKKAYISSLTLFILYYYENEKHLLHNTWLHAIDTFIYGIKNEKKKESSKKKIIRRLLIKCDPRCPPIMFENYCPKLFMRYLLSLQDNNQRRLGIASYRNRRSALFHLFRMYNFQQTTEFKLELNILFRGLKRKVTIEKQSGEGRIQTGKNPMTFSLYHRLNEYMLLEATTESVFARAFLCISWNLVCRSANTTSIHLHHMEWIDDALAIFFAHMKNDQCGERKRDPRHIYANPLDPVVCPILALSMYFTIFSVSGKKDTALFPGESQYNRFSTYLCNIMEKHRMAIKNDFGICVDDIGVHSIRKGAASYISSGATCAPPQVATNIRAGWTMGVIQDTYLRYEAAGDQYVGRVVSGLPICSAKFAVLPPQFHNVCETDLKNFITLSFPNFPQNLQHTAKLFLASLIYHYDELSHKYLPITHPIHFCSFLLSNKLKTFKKSIRLLYAWEDDLIIDVVPVQGTRPSALSSEDTNMDSSSESPLESSLTIPREQMMIPRATGIPAHVCILADMQKVIRSQQHVLTQIQRVIKDEFDERNIGGLDSYFNGKKMDDWISNFETRIIKKIDSTVSKNDPPPGSKSSPFGGMLFHWGGRFRKVPHGWIFPKKMTLHNAWKRYFLVDDEKSVCPLRYITGADLNTINGARKILSKYKTLMAFMVAEAKTKNKFIENPTALQVDDMYGYVSGKVLSLSNNVRAEQFLWVTHYHYVQKYLSKTKKQ